MHVVTLRRGKSSSICSELDRCLCTSCNRTGYAARVYKAATKFFPVFGTCLWSRKYVVKSNSCLCLINVKRLAQKRKWKERIYCKTACLKLKVLGGLGDFVCLYIYILLRTLWWAAVFIYATWFADHTTQSPPPPRDAVSCQDHEWVSSIGGIWGETEVLG